MANKKQEQGRESPPPWALKTEYVTTQITYKALAEKHGITYANLVYMGRREKWGEERRAYRRRLCEDIKEMVAEKVGAREKERLLALQEAADKLTGRINGILDDGEQFQRYIVGEKRDGEAVSSERVFQKADTKAIRDLTASMKDLAVTVRNLYDLPTAQEQSAMDLALARLTLDREKAAEKAGEEDAPGVVELAATLPEEDGHEGD